MAKFNDSYYDPPEEDETCRVCHHQPDDCTCPKCSVCGEVGNPACINVHVEWKAWGHFNFQLSEKEQKLEQEREMMENIQEQDMWRAIDKAEKVERSQFDVVECSHRGYIGKYCGDCGQVLV